VARQVRDLWTWGCPFPSSSAGEEFQKATREAVNASAEKYANPANATLLLVGDLSKIEAGIRELKIGEVVVIDAKASRGEVSGERLRPVRCLTERRISQFRRGRTGLRDRHEITMQNPGARRGARTRAGIRACCVEIGTVRRERVRPRESGSL